jgi:MFS family permease
MPLAGRMVDRIGGGRVAIAGCAILTLATLPLVSLHAGTSSALVPATLVLRGLGLGAAMMPAMAAAYARLGREQVPRATSALNAIQRVGGSIGTALLAVVLQHETRAALGGGGGSGALLGPIPADTRAHLAGSLSTAFGHTFAWAAGMTLIAVVPAALLVLAERAREPSKPRFSTQGGHHARAET